MSEIASLSECRYGLYKVSAKLTFLAQALYSDEDEFYEGLSCILSEINVKVLKLADDIAANEMMIQKAAHT